MVDQTPGGTLKIFLLVGNKSGGRASQDQMNSLWLSLRRRLQPAPFQIFRRYSPVAAALLGAYFLPTSVDAATINVSISGFAFSPATATVHVGDTVTWIQKDSIQHTVTSDGAPALLNSSLLSLNQKFSHTFTDSGTFAYHCIPHASFMKGTVVVLPAPNQPPTVSLTAPTNGTVLPFPAKFLVSADASDTDGSVTSVQFFAGTNSLGSVTVPPFQLQVTNLTAGVYSLSAVATDNLGATNTSSPVTVTIDAPPTIRISSPGSGALFLSPASFTLKVAAADTDGTVDHVEYLDGTTSLGVVSSPFSLVWNAASSGLHLLTAIATDNLGIQTTSAPISLTISSAAAYAQHNLVSDLPGLADKLDTNLVNPWAIAFSPTGPFWINDNHSGLSTVYNTDGSVQTLVVAVPTAAGGTPPGSPTGIIFNGSTNFQVASGLPARFIFSTEDGTLSGWNSGSTAVLKVDNSADGTVYKGLAIAQQGGSNLLYATDFHHGRVDVFDDHFAPVHFPGAFSDPTLPSGYAPFGIRSLGGKLFVTYALQDGDQHDDVAGPGHGFVNVFDSGGQLIRRFASTGKLNSPWGIALAPSGFAQYSGTILIGNFGDGTVQVYDAVSGNWVGTLSDIHDEPIVIEGLWDIAFGNGGRGGDANRLYFVAGISGGIGIEEHGLFGSISAVPTVRITRVTAVAGSLTVEWAGDQGPFMLQHKSALTDSSWTDVQSFPASPAVIPLQGTGGFFRVQY